MGLFFGSVSIETEIYMNTYKLHIGTTFVMHEVIMYFNATEKIS